MKRKSTMHHTLKTNLFASVPMRDASPEPAAMIIDNHLVINPACCDLRTPRERFDPETRALAPSAVENILYAESFLTLHYAKRTGEMNTLYDFITVDCSEGNDRSPLDTRMKDLLCSDGLYLPLDKLEAVGWIPHDEAEIISIGDHEYVRYRAVMQSASENRQCKLTATTYRWAGFARTVSSGADYLTSPTQTAQKAIARQGLCKTNGNVVEGFDFTFAVVPDLETEIVFDARCFYDAVNEIREETITTRKTATDGCGFITSQKARELAGKLGLGYVPSAFQVRYGQVKGVLLVFDFDEYSDGRIKEDILFTRSMWKADFDISKASFLVANISKDPGKYAEWNYQMFCTLNSQLSYDDVSPFMESIRGYMSKALSSPEDALNFLGILSNISVLDYDEGEKNEYDCVDRVSAVIRANPQLAMNIRWVKQSIKRKIDLVSRKMLSGKIPMPESSLAIMGADPVAFFNRLRQDDSGYGFSSGDPVIPPVRRIEELDAYEFCYGGYEGELLAFRNPLTHWAQIRKLTCVSRKDSAYWYRHLRQVILFNVHDETNLGLAGADYDGDTCFLTKLFTDKFRQADYIIYNNNDTGGGQQKEVLTEAIVQRGIRANLTRNMLGVICNVNTRALELLHDPGSLRKFVRLAGFMESRGFDCPKMQTPYLPKFQDVPTATAYLEALNHQLTTLSELEVDRPKTGYVNRFCQNKQEYALPFLPFWFGKIKGLLDPFSEKPAEEISRNNFGEPVRTLYKSYAGKTVKIIRDTLKTGKYGEYVQRLIELMTDGDSIMANIRRFVQEEILDMEIDANSCFSVLDTLEGAGCLDFSEAERITGSVRAVYRDYRQDVAANISAWRAGNITEDDFNNALENIIRYSGEQLRDVSSDRAALAFVAYKLSMENGHTSQSFPFLAALDGMVALLADVKAVDFYSLRITRDIPLAATHLIVFNRKCRLPENVDPGKTYFGDVSLPNGSYELHRDLKGNISLIVPRAAKNKLNHIPYRETAKFSIKVSYKASELLPEHRNGEYVTGLLADHPVSFRETTMDGNTQYCLYAGDIWAGTVFDDQANTWVLRKEVMKTLTGRDYSFVGIPRTGVNTNSNSFLTGNGVHRTAQVLTFIQA